MKLLTFIFFGYKLNNKNKTLIKTKPKIKYT